MSDRPDHFHLQRTPSRAATDAAVEAARTGAPDRWLGLARRAVMFTARGSSPDFTTEGVWSTLEGVEGGVPDEPRALGAVMRSLKAEGRIEPTGEFRPALRVKSHRRPLTVWRLVSRDAARLEPADRLVSAYRAAMAVLLDEFRGDPPS